jgi:hypothetical protein
MSDPDFSRPVQRLHQLTVYSRWVFVVGCWLAIAPWSLWKLRDDIALLQQYFTWSSLRYGLAYQPLAYLGLAFCIAITGSVLVWQSRNLLWGLPTRERERLEKRVRAIHTTGPRHPLWHWVMGKRF